MKTNTSAGSGLPIGVALLLVRCEYPILALGRMASSEDRAKRILADVRELAFEAAKSSRKR